nr:hypothetical protein [Bradyrhizobium sp. BR 10289]
MTEAPVIVQMIADQAEALAPAHGSAERYKRLEWINFLPSEIHKSFSPLFAPALNDPVHGGGGYCFAMLTRGDRMKFDRSAMPNLAAYKALVAARPRVQPEPNFRGSSYLRLDL